MNDNKELLEKMGSIKNGAVTIFQGNMRIATSVIDESGQRAVGTNADPMITEIVLDNGQTYIGEVDIVAEKHLAMYQPIVDKDENIIGIWLVGPPIAVVGKTIMSLLTYSTSTAHHRSDRCRPKSIFRPFRYQANTDGISTPRVK